ncbi:hypothetical protein [Dipodfec virus UOA04_Rod_618]|nr:hypothetical protein [Dipodfec virus UOA04_Rod_618]
MSRKKDFKQVDFGAIRPLKTGLLQQNVYIRDAIVNKNALVRQSDKYLSIDEELSADGVLLKETVNDYPITPAYVNSFLPDSDYRNDPQSAIANSKPRQNLGDLTEFQAVNNMSMSEAAQLLQRLQEKLATAEAQVSKDKDKGNQEIKEDPKNE